MRRHVINNVRSCRNTIIADVFLVRRRVFALRSRPAELPIHNIIYSGAAMLHAVCKKKHDNIITPVLSRRKLYICARLTILDPFRLSVQEYGRIAV